MCGCRSDNTGHSKLAFSPTNTVKFLGYSGAIMGLTGKRSWQKNNETVRILSRKKMCTAHTDNIQGIIVWYSSVFIESSASVDTFVGWHDIFQNQCPLFNAILKHKTNLRTWCFNYMSVKKNYYFQRIFINEPNKFSTRQLLERFWPNFNRVPLSFRNK